jgi:hypothetical protein
MAFGHAGIWRQLQVASRRLRPRMSLVVDY